MNEYRTAPAGPALFADPACWKFRREHTDEFASFGCGPGGVGDLLVPDTVWGLSVKDACRIHDYYYRFSTGNSEEDRARADRIFKNNMIRIVRFYTKSRLLLRLRLIRVKTYYNMVRFAGGTAYWEERNDAKELETV